LGALVASLDTFDNDGAEVLQLLPRPFELGAQVFLADEGAGLMQRDSQSRCGAFVAKEAFAFGHVRLPI
jgi:hypothetical protein